MVHTEGKTVDRHVIEAMGMTKVVIEEGRVVEVGEPKIKYCPIFHKTRGVTEITSDLVKENVEFRIKDFGMCTANRKMKMDDFLHFGISELLCMSISKGILDAAVLVCDGAGTAVVSDPELLQGIGGRISGIVETSPIQEVQEALGLENVLDVDHARIDQIDGVRRAFELGYKRIGVTVASARDSRLLRDLYGPRIVILMVHTTGITLEEANTIFDTSDITTACASKSIWAVAEKKALLQVGDKVPIFAASPIGELILKARMDDLKMKAAIGPGKDRPNPLI
jgi:putative methanogenesis marker protein 8